MKQKKQLRSLFYLFSLLLTTAANAEQLMLPEAVTNNAVAQAKVDGRPVIFSFNGLSSGKRQKDIHGRAFAINLIDGYSKEIASLPNGIGRLASTAVSLNNKIYVLGGYTVGEDDSEVSTSEVYQYFPTADRYQLVTHIPVPVDDSVALVYQQRYIYLVSGWHDTGNVSLVQVYDSKQNQWFNATPFPGAPVFGHAGGIVGNQFVIADGVKVESVINGKRNYGAADQSWMATINPRDPAVIQWKRLNKHPYKPFYRMASTGVAKDGLVVFASGSDNPYNYDGIGYNKVPSEPSDKFFGYDLSQAKWVTFKPLAAPSMDHRGLLIDEHALYIIGGMGNSQKVLSSVTRIPRSRIKGNSK